MCMDVDKQQQFHSNKCIGNKIIHKEITGSTNADAAAMAEELPHGAVITADAQTAGRGRRGRAWVSRGGENLYFSLLLRPDFAPDKAPMLTLIMALAVARGIELVYDAAGAVQIKWPNDIVIHGKKVCGILTEMQVEAGRIGHVVIGVGVNVRQRDFSGEGLEHASSLDMELGDASGRTDNLSFGGRMAMRPLDESPAQSDRDIREILLQVILTQFEQYYRQFCEAESLQPLHEAYQTRLVNLGKGVKVLDPCGSFRGVALGIDEQGQLLVQKADGSRVSIYSGEVSVRGLYGYV